MGLRLDPREAFRGFRNARFVGQTLAWGFVLGPATAWAITRLVPLEAPYAAGLLLMGMTPCAPFLPMIVGKAKGDLAYTAAFMLLSAVGTVLFMPFAVPRMLDGMTVSAWTIAKPLLVVILLPMAVGMLILRGAPKVASPMRPYVKKVTALFTLATLVLCAVIYGKGLLGVAGSFAVASQLVFFLVVTVVPYAVAFGLPHDQKIVISAGMATRNLGAALAPLMAVPTMDPRATLMVVLGFPLMVIAAMLAAKGFGRGR
jgi:BASS family bile acid:Na+ symporter